MSAASDVSYSAAEGADLQAYRVVSRSAIVAVVLAGVGLVPLLMTVYSTLAGYGDAFPVGMLTAFIGVVAASMSVAGLLAIRRYPAEVTGSKMARTALAMGAAQLVLGAGLAVYTHVNEVPAGYERITFSDLQPDPDYPELPVPPKALELSGKPIFIKGYMHPGVAGTGRVSHFILVNDFGTCCFGGAPKPTHMVEVQIPAGKAGIAYSRVGMKLAGKFAVSRSPGQSLGLNGVWYHLVLDEAK